MPRCGHCGELVSRHETVCPTCARTPHDDSHLDASAEPAGDARSSVAIARFRNAAEAGYFAHELARAAEISTNVMVDENFDALAGYWSTRFVLTVPEDQADTALYWLQRLIDPSEADDTPFDTNLSEDINRYDSSRDVWDDEPSHMMPADASAESSVNWVPIVLTLAAGSVVFWGVRAMNARPQAHAAAAGEGKRLDVWNRLATPDRPWVQQLETGRRELRFDPIRREGMLYEDLDGDGRFETEIELRELAPQD